MLLKSITKKGLQMKLIEKRLIQNLKWGKMILIKIRMMNYKLNLTKNKMITKYKK